jgi:diguanylate cyclase (GGDEF)-like protein
MQLESSGHSAPCRNHSFSLLEAQMCPNTVICNGNNLSEICKKMQTGGEYTPICIMALLARKHGTPFGGALNYAHTIEEERDQAIRDTLYDKDTGALKKQIFVHKVNERLIARRKEDAVCTFVMLDLDCFKEVNDKFLHTSGDLVLVSLVETAKKRIRENDLIGRLGGDEFGIFFDGANQSEAACIMEKIREEFSTIEFPFNTGLPQKRQVHPSFSFGCAVCEKEDDVFYEVYNLADKLMYTEKERRKAERRASPSFF